MPSRTDAWPAIRAAVDRHRHAPLPSDGKLGAAVLIALVPYEHDPHIVFQVRSHQVEHHKGEISLPGGAADPTDRDLIHTALRESHEELGIHPTHVDVVGELSHYVTHTGFHVTPYVGLLDRAPYPYTPSAIEVAEVLDVPLGHLLASDNWSHDEWHRDGVHMIRRAYHWNGHRIWGATAAMLQAFLTDVAAELDLAH
jgi:8-oxo-dGTP pyrophosphatase MutT (NUDIX family)